MRSSRRLARPLVAILTIIALLGVTAPASAYSYYQPEFQSVSIYPASATPGTPVTICVRARDPQGVRDGSAELASPSGKQRVSIHLHWDYGYSELVGTFTPNAYHESGHWTVASLQISDNERETTTVDGQRLTAGFSLSGGGAPDLTPPVAGAISVTPSSVAAGQPFTFSVSLSDAASGVAGGTVSYAFHGTSDVDMTPNDYLTVTDAKLVPAAGGVWRAEFIAPVDPGPSRRLSLYEFNAWDAAGNHLTMNESALGLSVSVGQPSLPDVGGIADDRVNLFYGHPLPFADWADRDLTRLGELYGLVYSNPDAAAEALTDEIANLDAALAATEGDLFMPAQPSGLRLASPGVTGRLLALSGALRGRLALYSILTTASTLTYTDVIRWADLSFPLEASMGPVLADHELYQTYGALLTDLVARGLADSTIPAALYGGQHITRLGWNDDLIPDNVVWLTPYAFSDDVAGYHDSDEGDIFIGFDRWSLEQPQETVDTAVHELGHHIHSVLLGERDSAGWAEYLRLRGIPQDGDDGAGHDGMREEAFASDVVQAYAPAAIVNSVDYDSPYPGPDEVSNLGATIGNFINQKAADGMPDLFLLTNPGREVAMTATPDFPLAGRARPGERVTILLTDDLSGMLDSTYYGESTVVTADADGRFAEKLHLYGEGLYAIQAEIDRGGSKYIETAFLVYTKVDPLRVSWNVPEDTPLNWLPVTGTAPAGASVQVNNVKGIAGSDGTFTVKVPLVSGPNTVRLSVVTGDGRSRTLSTEVNCNPSSAIAVDQLPDAVRTASLAVSGSGPAGSNVVISGGTAIVSTRAGSDGRFSTTVSLNSGLNHLVFRSWGPDSTEADVIYDPSATLVLYTPATTNHTRLVISGRTDPGATVIVNGKATPVDAAGGFVAVIRPTASGTNVGVTATDAAGNTASATRTVVLTGSASPAQTLRDLAGHWSRQEVENLITLGIVNGLPGGVYQPDRSITRAEFVKMLAVATGLSPDARAYPAVTPGATGLGAERLPFIDIAQHWANGYIQAAVRAGFVVPTDYAEGRFDPDARISRREIAVMAVRALGLGDLAERSDGGAQFVDADSIGPEWAGYAVVAQAEGIVTGLPGGVFAPDESATRAQAATIISRVLAKLER